MAKLEYRIHPSVGIARMGDSPDHFFVGKETPNRPSNRANPVIEPIPDGSPETLPVASTDQFRDPADRIAKQAARFRVFAYYYETPRGKRDDYPTKVWEVTADDYDIKWTVSVQNTKAGVSPPTQPAQVNLSSQVDADFYQPKTLQPTPQARFALGSAVLDPKVDSKGTLLIIGSNGKAENTQDGYQPDPNDQRYDSDLILAGWEDDAGDGSVEVEVTPKPNNSHADHTPPVEHISYKHAHVVIGPPDFGADATHIVSLFDLAMDLAQVKATRHTMPGPGVGGPFVYHTFQNFDYYRTAPSTSDDIDPVLQSYLDVMDVSRDAQKHARRPIAQLRQAGRTVVDKLRDSYKSKTPPENYFTGYRPPTPLFGRGERNMPLLKILALPRLKRSWMETWANGGANGAANWDPLKDLHRPRLLDEAHLGSMCGGGFWPGIEVGRDAAMWQNWEGDYGAVRGHMDVRYKGGVGSMTHNLAVPWQHDFESCRSSGQQQGDEYWPTSRPDHTRRVNDGTFRMWDRKQVVEGDGSIDTKAEKVEMKEKWAQLGFMRRQEAGDLREVERESNE